jgi:hypothetical protein
MDLLHHLVVENVIPSVVDHLTEFFLSTALAAALGWWRRRCRARGRGRSRAE